MLIWLATGLLVIGVYPFTFYPLTLLVLRRVLGVRKPRASVPRTWPHVSILFCGHNEEASIAAKLDNCLAALKAYPGPADALAYLDGCTDRTEEIARTHPAVAESGLIQLIVNPRRAGKSHGMTGLAATARGEVLVFTDANVMLAPDCLMVAAKDFSDPAIGCVCSKLTYTNPSDSATAEAGSAYWRFEERLKQVESDLRSTVSADGSLFALRKALFRPVPDDIIDDTFTTYGTFIQGFRAVRDPDFRCFEKHAVAAKDEFRRKIRIACRGMNCVRLLLPELLRLDALTLYMVVAHKILRYFTGLLLITGGVLLCVGLAAAGHFAAILGIALAMLAGAALAYRQIRPFNMLFAVLAAFLAVSLGVVESFRGRRYQTWAIPGSSRQV